MLSMMLPTVRPDVPADQDELSQRVADALGLGHDSATDDRNRTEELELDMAMTFSDREVPAGDGLRIHVGRRNRTRQEGRSRPLRLKYFDPLATRRLKPDKLGGPHRHARDAEASAPGTRRHYLTGTPTTAHPSPGPGVAVRYIGLHERL